MAEMITGARKRIELPAPLPIPSGLVSVARVIDLPDGSHELMGVEALTDACATAEEWTEWCTTDPVGVKLFDDEMDYVVGDPFAVYAGVSCDLQRLDEGERRARARLGWAETRAVELHIDADLSTDGDVVDLGGPYPLEQGIGAAEAFAATVYGGAPTLLVPRQIAPCVCGEGGGVRPGLDGTLTTCAGSRVALLTTPVDVPVTFTGPFNLYVTGQITLLRGPVRAISVPQQPSDDGTFAPMRALAERVYVPIFDCLVAKVEVTCS
jgi:hypothetical protein